MIFAGPAPLPIPLDAPTQAACAARDAGGPSFTVTVDPFKYSSFGTFPLENDAVYLMPDTPYFHALWIDGLIRDLPPSGGGFTPGPLGRACVITGARKPGDVFEASGVRAASYIMVTLVRRSPEIAGFDGGLVTTGPHAIVRGEPSARFFAQEIGVEEGQQFVKQYAHVTLALEIP